MTQKTHPAFELTRRQAIDALNLTVEEYRHRATGAQHIHLDADNAENVFLVALRTVPQDSTGVAHILEHTALCGSKRYPVRDPFFMMTRRSLNTFMNAMTSPDWTAYPFASQNRKDFDNLLDVYLDAVFFANLDELDFAQEGHRLDFAETGNPDSELVYKGVVYNEMKGAMSSVPAQLWQKMSSYLFPTNTYHHNSGGEPDCIPDLTYEQLQAFYREHYHPSNAVFMTFGNIPAAEHQSAFEERALKHFDALDTRIQVSLEKRRQAPIRVEEAYALEGEENLEGKTHVVLGWLLGSVIDLEGALEAHLLASILLDNSASPLAHALETSELGQAPSPLCGLEDSQREMSFVCGLEGCREEDVRAVEQMILETLESVAENGVPQSELESSLHQLELAQREIGGDGLPFGLQLVMTALTAATHHGDPIALLDVEDALASLRHKITDPAFIKNKARELLLDNPHRVTLSLRPDSQLAERTQAAERARLAEIKQRLSDADKQAIIQQAEALDERQQQEDEDSALPKVTLADIPAEMPYVAGTDEQLSGHPLRCYEAGTNGLVYQQLVIKLPQLTERQRLLLPLYTDVVTEVGLGDQGYLAVQSLQAAQVGGIGARTSFRAISEDAQTVDGYFVITTKALANRADQAAALIRRTLDEARFDELDRLRELAAQQRSRREQSVTGNGHMLAMTAATAGMGPAAKLSHQTGGLEGIAFLMELDNSLNDRDALAALAGELAEIHQLIQAAPAQFMLVGEHSHMDDYRQQLAKLWPETPQNDSFNEFTLAPVKEPVREAWLTNTQVNFCAKAYPTVCADHPDAAALTVLAGVLRNGYLHRTVREKGGAYGGGATQDNNNGAFRFFSYRDPRLAETLEDFDGALEWLGQTSIDDNEIEQSILGVISAIDKPGSPAGEARQTYQAELFGRTRDKREQFRQRVLGVTGDDIQRVARQYLHPEHASTAVVAPAASREAVEALGLEVRSL